MTRFVDDWNDAIEVESLNLELVRIVIYPDNQLEGCLGVALDIDTAIQFSKELRKSIAKAKEVSNV